MCKPGSGQSAFINPCNMDMLTTIITALISSISTGSITYLVTLNSAKKKANAEAESSELNNVLVAIKIWREMAEQLSVELNELRMKYDGVLSTVVELKGSIDKLNASNTRILAMLNKMKPDNFTKIIEDIKRELEHAKS